MKISFASISYAGPRAINEDFVDCWQTGTGVTIACVADGLGGMGGGDVASRLAVTKFKEHLSATSLREEDLKHAAHAAHEAILAAQQLGSTNRMATTLTAVVLLPSKILGVHCGDSRAAIARSRGIKRLTTDHSEGQRLFDAGKLSKDELATYQRKHILESALGDREEPRIDTFHFDWLPGDRLILTTDGVHNLVLLREMQWLCSRARNARELTERVAAAVRGYGPTDNFSMVAVFAD